MRSPVVWVLLTVFILITGAGLWLSALNGFQSGVTFALMFVIVFSTMLGVGLIIISRQLSNVIGWLLVVAAPPITAPRVVSGTSLSVGN